MVRWAAIILALLLTACGQTETREIVFAVATAPSVLDPRLAGDAASERVNALLYDRLVVLDRQGKPRPSMASWKRLEPSHYRVRLLPQRTTFWDGRLPRAADVVATYRSLLRPELGSPHASALSHILEVKVSADDDVDFILSRPDPEFPARLTVGIAPAERLRDAGLARAPMGSGPFVFAGWREDGGLNLERRSDHQGFALLPVADPTMRALKLLRGEAQLVQNDLPAELFAYLGDQSALHMLEAPGTTFAYIGFNLADPVLADHRVRAAIAHAIDRKAIIRHLFAGRAQIAESVLRPEHWAGAGDLVPHEYDPDLARRYLTSAGYTQDHPLHLSYKTSTDPFRLRIAHVFQSQLAAVGIQLKISSYDWGTFFGDIREGRFQIYSLAWVGVNTPDILRYAFHSASGPPGGANRGRYDSAHVDTLIRQAERLDPVEAAPLYAEVQRTVHGDLVYVPLWYESNVAVMRGLEGYQPGFDGNYLALNSVMRKRGPD